MDFDIIVRNRRNRIEILGEIPTAFESNGFVGIVGLRFEDIARFDAIFVLTNEKLLGQAVVWTNADPCFFCALFNLPIIWVTCCSV